MNGPGRFGFVAMVVSMLCLSLGSAAARQNIAGAVIDASRGMPLARIHVAFLDGINATVVATTTTDLSGNFDSVDLPAGSYRVRFSDPAGAGAPGFYIPEIYDAEIDEFCRGTPVVVSAGSTTEIREDLRYSDPMLVTTADGDLNGTVVDAATRAPISGIQVSVFRADNGEAVALSGGSGVTDAAGFYKVAFRVAGSTAVRIRFSDPSGTYFPEFAGTSDLARDEFCTAAIVSLNPQVQRTLDAEMNRIPPEHNTQQLLDIIETLPIDSNTKAALGTPLIRAVDLLTDDNLGNNNGVCGQLGAFITRVDMEERRGQLSATDASRLRFSAQTTQSMLGCR